MNSSLEIAQQHELIPDRELAERIGLLTDEVEPYGRYKAKISLSLLDRVEPASDAKLVCVTGHDPHPGRRGQHHDRRRPDRRAGRHRQASGRVPAASVTRPGIWDQGRRGGRWPGSGRPNGGTEPPLHRRHPCDRSRQQPPGGDDRRLAPARQPARHRRTAGALAPRGGHERPHPAEDHDRSAGARPTATRGRPGSTSPRRPRSWRSRRSRATCAISARRLGRITAGYSREGRQAGDGRGSPRRRRDGRVAQGCPQAEPGADARGAARAGALRAARDHRPRQQLARRGLDRACGWASTRSRSAASARTWGWRSSSTSFAGSGT